MLTELFYFALFYFYIYGSLVINEAKKKKSAAKGEIENISLWEYEGRDSARNVVDVFFMDLNLLFFVYIYTWIILTWFRVRDNDEIDMVRSAALIAFMLFFLVCVVSLAHKEYYLVKSFALFFSLDMIFMQVLLTIENE